jgi:hypothetical protein
VSGLEHELFLWYLTRSWGTTWLAFFTLQVIKWGVGVFGGAKWCDQDLARPAVV